MRAREVHLLHRREADGEVAKELVFESARSPPLRTKSLGWLNRDSRAKPAVAFEGDTPKEFTNLLRLLACAFILKSKWPWIFGTNCTNMSHPSAARLVESSIQTQPFDRV